MTPTGQLLAYVYSSENPNEGGLRKVLTLDEARRIASNIAKLPDLRTRGRPHHSAAAKSVSNNSKMQLFFAPALPDKRRD